MRTCACVLGSFVNVQCLWLTHSVGAVIVVSAPDASALLFRLPGHPLLLPPRYAAPRLYRLVYARLASVPTAAPYTGGSTSAPSYPSRDTPAQPNFQPFASASQPATHSAQTSAADAEMLRKQQEELRQIEEQKRRQAEELRKQQEDLRRIECAAYAAFACVCLRSIVQVCVLMCVRVCVCVVQICVEYPLLPTPTLQDGAAAARGGAT